MKAPFVSVVMPAFNAGQHLITAVHSIVEQDFADLELIIVDDGSTDNSFDALRSLSDSRIRIYRNERNKGLVETRNLGLDLARGRLIAVLDSDDVARPARIKRQVEAFEGDADLALLGSNADLIDSNGCIFGDLNVGAYSDAEVRKHIYRGNRFIQSSIMMRAALVRQLGGYAPGIHIAEDYALWLKFVRRYKVGNLQERLVGYRVHENQVSRTKIHSMYQMARAVQLAAWKEAVESGHSAGLDAPFNPGLWSRLRARPGTLGADCLYWAKVYRKMGNLSASRSMARYGLMRSPFSREMFSLTRAKC